MIEIESSITITKQSELLQISKSSHYYEHTFTEIEFEIMWEIDKIYTEYPYYWNRRISKELEVRWYDIWRKKTRTFMCIMCISAIYPKKRTSIPNDEHKKYPYLLKWLCIDHPNQVWSTDITYIKLPWWFVYLIVIMDWYSRYIIARDVGICMDDDFCCSVLKKALLTWTPEIFNTDQWSQFTWLEFTGILEWKECIKISMDWKWRCYDNIRNERLWRTMKYEDIYIHDYQTPNDVYHWLSMYINKYNNSRLHSSLNYSTPYKYYNQRI